MQRLVYTPKGHPPLGELVGNLKNSLTIQSLVGNPGELVGKPGLPTLVKLVPKH
jgi:hypothetical protein